jgi:hypothetical protein
MSKARLLAQEGVARSAGVGRSHNDIPGIPFRKTEDIVDRQRNSGFRGFRRDSG